MNIDDIKRILKKGESHDVEFKERFGETQEAGGLSGGVSGGVNILEYIKNNPGKRTTQMEYDLNIPKRTLERQLKKMKQENKIEFRGSPKSGGYWVIVK